jgi:hypothetical protein
MPWIAPTIGAAGSVAGGLLGKSAAKSGGSTQTTNQDTATYSQLNPHQSALPLYAWYAQNANRLMGQQIPYFPGQTYVGPSQGTQQGVGKLQEGANAMLPFLGQMGQNYDFLSNAADVANNPYVQGMLGANANQVNRQLTEQWLPAVNRGAQAVNAMGSDRQGLMQGQAVGRAAEALSNANANTMGQAYAQGLGAQQNALGNTADVLRNLLAPGMGMIGAGQTAEDYQQRALGDQMARFQYMFQEPYNRMNSVLGWMQGLAPIGLQQGSQSQVTTAPNPYAMSPLQGAIGGMQMGGALGNSLGSIFQNWGNSGSQPSLGNTNNPYQMGGYSYNLPVGGGGGGFSMPSFGGGFTNTGSFGGTSIW